MALTTPMFNGSANPTVKTYREAGGKSLEGVIYAGFKYDPAAAKKLIDAYRAKLGFDPDFAALEDYDMVNMIAAAIRKNGYDGEGIRSFLGRSKISRASAAAPSAWTRTASRSCRWRCIR